MAGVTVCIAALLLSLGFMVTLALDTTTKTATSAVLSDDVVLAEWVGDATISPAAQLPGGVVDVLGRAGCRPDDVDVLAVAVGPGSFTGLRVGIATMQGLAVAFARPLIGISGLEALAACAAGESGTEDGVIIAPWVDAWRGEVYAGRYRGGVPLGEPTVGSPEEALADLDGPALFVGDGAAAHRALIAHSRQKARFAATMTPRLAPAIARLASARAQGGERPGPHAIAPLYVRRPDAELARDSRRAE
jgi:tRNA threonylcarbamoyladenosine biosynthesis protein TsaB